MAPGLSEWVQIAIGAFVVGLGLTVLLSVRFAAKQVSDAVPHTSKARLSVPTRYLLAFALLVQGYHIVVWAFPTGLTPLQFPREIWWVIPIIGATAVFISATLDRNQVADRRQRRGAKHFDD
ncbi:MAG: hypothetical protein KF768_07170 [Phycisphaeraceae bacterium]|nr:hypothetical protein [Phycisphaeraceae bacterium]